MENWYQNNTLFSFSVCDFAYAAYYQIFLSSHISLHVPTNLHIYTYIYMFIHVFVLHMHDLQNEQLNKQGERFKENVILKFHIYHEQ